jgi:hypothetical protein
MKNKVTLYIATHNITGLKYFGKTTKYFNETDLQKNYHGSGTYWTNHLKKHSDDVTMKIFGVFSLDENSMDYVEPIALKFSKDNNIEEDYNRWANQKPENGLDGILKGHKMPPRSESHIKKLSESHKGMRHTEESKNKMSEIKKGKPSWNKGKTDIYSRETLEKMSESKRGNTPWNKGRKEETVSCPYCEKIGGKGAMKRYHFDNCKHKRRTI